MIGLIPYVSMIAGVFPSYSRLPYDSDETKIHTGVVPTNFAAWAGPESITRRIFLRSLVDVLASRHCHSSCEDVDFPTT